MNKYIVKLIPTGRFFFGGDMTFSISGDGNKSHNEKFSSYIIRSLKFPQQTSLLGMLRFLLLSNDSQVFDTSSQKIIHKGEAENLIGKQSFTVNNPTHEENVFGKIKSIGSCFLYKDKECYYQAPFDYTWEMNSYEVQASLNGKSVSIPSIKVGKKEYTSKTGIDKCFLSKSGNVLKEEDVFQEDGRIGIRKGINGKTEDEAFYKQIGYRLKNECCFVFDVEVSDIDLTDSKYNGQLVSVGADSSMFIIQIEKGSIDVDLPSSYNKKNKDWEKIVLLADTYLPNTDLEKVNYAISEIKPFRFISTTIENKSYHIMHNLHDRSKRYNLFAAGSVFLVKDAASFKMVVEEKREFVQIGYNHCK